MDIQLNVPSLEDLAFEMSYKEIMSNLILCYEHRPEGKRFQWLPFSSIVSTSEILSSENVRRLVRNRLNQHLVGTLGEKVREKYVKKFYDSFSNHAEKEELIEAWAFLDCILEEDIYALEIYAAFPDSPPNPKLIPTVSKWSPHLEKLTLNFNYMKRGFNTTDRVKVIEEVKPMIRSLDSLQNLTHLLLFGIGEEVTFTVFSLVGKSCPKLNHLTVEKYSMWAKPLLALIFGELLNDLADFNNEAESSWWRDDALTNLVVPIEFLTPICSSLRELRLLGYDFKQQHVTKHAVAFALRHFPMLQRIYGMRTSQAITTLYETEERSGQYRFRMACQEAAERGNCNLPIPFPSRNLSCTFNGHLSLIRIEDVNVYHREMLNAVGALCPLLKEVVFCSKTLECKHDYSDNSDSEWEQPTTLESTVSPGHLESILRAWPKLISIECEEVSSSHLKAILTVFGPELHKLRLEKCPQIKLEQLAVCSKLESLKIVNGSLSQRSQETDSALDADSYLPELKIFESNICMGRKSHLFEEKSSSLIKLDIHCCHIGIVQAREERPPCPKRFKGLGHEETKWLELHRIGELWAPLEFLAIRQFATLSLDMVAELVPHLPKLKKVILPQRICSCDVLLFQSMKAQLSSRIPSATISFENFGARQKCPIVEKQ